MKKSITVIEMLLIYIIDIAFLVSWALGTLTIFPKLAELFDNATQFTIK